MPIRRSISWQANGTCAEAVDFQIADALLGFPRASAVSFDGQTKTLTHKFGRFSLAIGKLVD